MGGHQGAEQFRIRFESRTVVREAQSMDQRVGFPNGFTGNFGYDFETNSFLSQPS